MRQRNSEAVTELANATEAALREKGYEIIRVPVSRSAASDNLDVAALPQVDADTILDLSFTAGFIDHGEGGKWVPLVLTTIRAYNSSTRSLLFRVTIGCFGGSPKPEYARFQFEHMADVLIRPDDAADGLKHCSQLLGPLVAKRFGS
jgi:hypothetical protein